MLSQYSMGQGHPAGMLTFNITKMEILCMSCCGPADEMYRISFLLIVRTDMSLSFKIIINLTGSQKDPTFIYIVEQKIRHLLCPCIVPRR